MNLGVRWIVAYKLARAAAMFLLVIVVVVARARGFDEPFDPVVGWIHRHAATVGSLTIAKTIERSAAALHAGIVAVALGVDGASSFAEGFILHRGYRWAPWVVVVTTSVFLPLEIYAIARHPSVLRALVLLVNVAIVAVLATRARVIHRQARA